MVRRFDNLLAFYGMEDGNEAMLLTDGNPNWPNLLKWLQVFHEESEARLKTPALGDRHQVGSGVGMLERKVIGAAFDIVTGCEHRQWDEVAKLLEMQHIILEEVDRRWA